MTKDYEKVPSGRSFGEPEIVELGIDHNGNERWYLATREGFQEIGEGSVLTLDAQHYQVGTCITLEEPIPEEDG